MITPRDRDLPPFWRALVPNSALGLELERVGAPPRGSRVAQDTSSWRKEAGGTMCVQRGFLYSELKSVRVLLRSKHSIERIGIGKETCKDLER